MGYDERANQNRQHLCNLKIAHIILVDWASTTNSSRCHSIALETQQLHPMSITTQQLSLCLFGCVYAQTSKILSFPVSDQHKTQSTSASQKIHEKPNHPPLQIAPDDRSGSAPNARIDPQAYYDHSGWWRPTRPFDRFWTAAIASGLRLCVCVFVYLRAEHFGSGEGRGHCN